MQTYAAEHEVPIAYPEVLALLRQLALISKAKTVLEIGGAIGYTAIAFAQLGLTVTSIEVDDTVAQTAKRFIDKAQLNDNIIMLTGDALQLLPTITSTFDLVFLDANKSHYIDYLPLLLPLLNKGGCLISDNVLYRGMVATDELVVRRKITIVRRLRQYLETLCAHPMLQTAIVPIGDGVALSTKVH